jgi:hypothetical protein
MVCRAQQAICKTALHKAELHRFKCVFQIVLELLFSIMTVILTNI